MAQQGGEGQSGATPDNLGDAQVHARGAETAAPTGSETNPRAPNTHLRSAQLQLKPLTYSDVPYHQDFGSASSAQNAHPMLNAFIKQIVKEGRSSGWDIRSWHKTGTHVFPKEKSAAGITVDQLSKEVNGETWYARASRHEDEGLKRWEVFDKVVREKHSQHEGEYTPNIYGTNTVLSWSTEDLRVVGEEVGMKGLEIEITNMYHGIPTPLNDRVFSVLLLSGVRTDISAGEDVLDECVVVQLPVDLSTFPDAIKQRCHHRMGSSLTYNPPSDAVTAEGKPKVGKKLVQGVYAALEKISRRRDEGQGTVNEWVMATTSDAKGVLPMFVQKLAVPGEIVKDVEYVYVYMDNHKAALE
jgi:hypothetical protein